MDRFKQLEIGRRLHKILSQRSKQGGYAIEQDCKAQLSLMIRQGIERIVLEKSLDNLGRIQGAEKNLGKFIDKMVNHAQHTGHYPYVGVMDYWDVKSRGLTFWPFA
jgi:hypothetical protein